MTCSGAVEFNYQLWVARYPEFEGVKPVLACAYFDEATLYCANKIGVIPNTKILLTLLNMLTAHIAALNSPTTAAGANPGTPPGRISNATEGSISAQFDFQTSPGSEKWYAQTKYGAAYWQATLPYRLSRYRPPRPGMASLGQLPWLFPGIGA